VDGSSDQQLQYAGKVDWRVPIQKYSNIVPAFSRILSTSSNSATSIPIIKSSIFYPSKVASKLVRLFLIVRYLSLLPIARCEKLQTIVMLVKLCHGRVFAPLFKVAASYIDFFTNFTRISACSFNECNSMLFPQNFSHPAMTEVVHHNKQYQALLHY